MVVPVAACPGPARAAFDVVAVHGPVDMSADMTLKQIAELAERTGRVGRHKPLGFYIGDFGYTVNAEIGPRGEADCSEPVHVTVTVMLANRHIEIGKELAAKPCLFSVVRDHYRRHAASDDAVLTEFAQALETALRRVPLPPLGHDPAAADEDRRKMEQIVSSMADDGIKSLDTARANARDGVDTADEIAKMNAEHCGNA